MNRVSERIVQVVFSVFMITAVSCTSPSKNISSSSAAVPVSIWEKVEGLPDLSGVEWVEENTFLAVHDAKYPGESSRPRVSLIKENNGSIISRPLNVDWPKASGPSSDLESIARIPGTRKFLLVESGNDGRRYQRIFLSELEQDDKILISEVVNWPVKIYNVEASSVVRIKEQLYFIYAERAHGKSTTQLKWAKMQLNPLRFENFSTVNYAAGIKGRGYRPIVGLTASEHGNLYAVTSYDPDTDTGPFRSYVSYIGDLRLTNTGNLAFIGSRKFADIITREGNKIEGITVKETKSGIEIYVGTDDEGNGASFQKLNFKK